MFNTYALLLQIIAHATTAIQLSVHVCLKNFNLIYDVYDELDPYYYKSVLRIQKLLNKKSSNWLYFRNIFTIQAHYILSLNSFYLQNILIRLLLNDELLFTIFIDDIELFVCNKVILRNLLIKAQLQGKH